MKKIFTFLPVAMAFMAIHLTGCNSHSPATPSNADTLPELSAKEIGIQGGFSAQTRIKFDSTVIGTFLDSFPKFKKFEKDIKGFYKQRDYAYAWYDEKGMIENANNLYNRILNISDEGIPDSLPYQSAFSLLLETSDDNGIFSPVKELMLTSQYLVYAKNVWEGLSEKQSLSTDWLLPRKKFTTQQLLDSLVSGRNVLENSPVVNQYNKLKAYLKKYNDIKKQGVPENIKAEKKTYRRNDSSATIAAIRHRLFLLGDLPEDDQSKLFDSTLEEAVKVFERRMGHKAYGIVNTSLIEAMNYPIEKRIEQILVNMERSRWVPVQLSNNFLLVNIPEFKLHVYEQDRVPWSMNVVVGKDQHKTAIFNGDLKYIVFSPYWNIPQGIMKNETLPAIRKNRNYLARHNMEWHNGSIRQKPGPNNSLGLVKFLFPNSHSIYLHDTPAKSLFNEDNRAFSHGCIRLEEPKKLAVYLLRNDTSWTEAKITAAMNGGKEKNVPLGRPIPVYITYFTSWVDSKGMLNFRNDIYKRDNRLAKMILEKPVI